MNPKLLIFDLDGTLIDSRADLVAGINHMRGRFGLDALPLETISGYIGNGVRKLVERSLQGAAVDIEAAMQINKTYYNAHLVVHTTLYDGVEQGLRALTDAGHQVALLTNKPGDPSRRILQHFGLLDQFCAVIGGGDVANLKPDPEGVARCMQSAQAEPADCWMIGDNYTDMAVAENAGISSAFVRYGFGVEHDHKPNAYFASFSELVEYFV